jgi:hypothetical protein
VINLYFIQGKLCIYNSLYTLASFIGVLWWVGLQRTPVKEANYTLASLTRSSVGSDELSSLQSSFKAANFIYTQIQKIHKGLKTVVDLWTQQDGWHTWANFDKEKIGHLCISMVIVLNANTMCCPVSRQWTFPTVTQVPNTYAMTAMLYSTTEDR